MSDPSTPLAETAGHDPASAGRSPLGSPPTPIRRGAQPARRVPRSVEEQLYREPYEFDFFQAVSLLERLSPERRPVGRQGSPGSEVARFRALQSLDFPASSIYEIHRDPGAGRPPVMTVAFMGLTGPSGVLPRHYTELLMRLAREAKGPQRHALRDWLDLFNHRLISLFYRAWEKYRFCVPYARSEFARPDPDTFTAACYSLCGLGMPTLRGRLRVGLWDDREGSTEERVLARVEDLSLLYYGGLLAQRPRSAINLQALLEDYFCLPVGIGQFQGQWMVLEPSSQSRLDGGPGNNRLAVSAVVGQRVWDVQGKIRVRLGPLSYPQFLEFLPDPSPTPQRKAIFLLAHLVRLYVGPELDFDVQLTLQAQDVPECRLGSEAAAGPRLGWNTWLRGQPLTCDADDAVFQPQEIRWLHDAPGAGAKRPE